ncbi:hypothetical protein GLYMA_13G134001v4 [Glycine max]|nr:hypothetical protein GLYMA_13G134001v4 [Glycine max]KAH1101333.1 hypothetical protein GYH30_036086 [Glycine max]
MELNAFELKLRLLLQFCWLDLQLHSSELKEYFVFLLWPKAKMFLH